MFKPFSKEDLKNVKHEPVRYNRFGSAIRQSDFQCITNLEKNSKILMFTQSEKLTRIETLLKEYAEAKGHTVTLQTREQFEKNDRKLSGQSFQIIEENTSYQSSFGTFDGGE